MRGRVLVWVFFAALLIPVIGMAFCWKAWRQRAYTNGPTDRRRRRVAQAGLVVGSFAVMFAAALPVAAMLPLDVEGAAGGASVGFLMVSGVSSPPLAAVLLAFGYGRERWLGIACVLLALAADMAMIVGAQG